MVGEATVVLLRHRRIEAPEPRLDVRDRDPELRRRKRAGEGRVDVAETTTSEGWCSTSTVSIPTSAPRRLLRVTARADAEEDVGRRQFELVKEDVRHSRRRNADLL